MMEFQCNLNTVPCKDFWASSARVWSRKIREQLRTAASNEVSGGFQHSQANCLVFISWTQTHLNTLFGCQQFLVGKRMCSRLTQTWSVEADLTWTDHQSRKRGICYNRFTSARMLVHAQQRSIIAINQDDDDELFPMTPRSMTHKARRGFSCFVLESSPLLHWIEEPWAHQMVFHSQRCPIA